MARSAAITCVQMRQIKTFASNKSKLTASGLIKAAELADMGAGSMGILR